MVEEPQCNMALRSAVFEALRRHEVSEQCFAEVAIVTHAALTTTQAEIEALRARVAELEGDNERLKGLNRTHIKSAFFAGFDAARQPNRSDAWEESQTRKRIDYPRATLGEQP